MNIQKKAIDLTDLAIGIVVLGVVVTVGAIVLTNMKDSRLTDLDSITTTNESVTPTDAGVTLTNTYVNSISECLNSSTSEVIAAGNYTLSVNTIDGVGTVVNTTGEYVANPWNCTYTTYNTSRADYALANDAAVGLAEYGNWFKIIVIVGVAAVVLSLIFMAFGGRKGNSDSSGSY